MAGQLQVDLQGRVAIVTGGSKGIGKEIAWALARSGARVAVVSRTLEDVKAVAAEINSQGLTAEGFACDVSLVALIEPMVEKVESAFGPVDILVNSAGLNIQQYAIDVSEAAWDKVIDVNLKGTFFTAQAVGRRMIPRRQGKIINISSQMGLVGYYRRSAYCASKGGVVQLTKVLAVEWAKFNVNVNAVAPTFIETEMTGPMFEEGDFREEVLSRIPLGRIGQPDDVTGAVLYLASDTANLVTGHTLLVDGGWVAW